MGYVQVDAIAEGSAGVKKKEDRERTNRPFFRPGVQAAANMDGTAAGAVGRRSTAVRPTPAEDRSSLGSPKRKVRRRYRRTWPRFPLALEICLPSLSVLRRKMARRCEAGFLTSGSPERLRLPGKKSNPASGRMQPSSPVTAAGPLPNLTGFPLPGSDRIQAIRIEPRDAVEPI